MSSAQLFDAAAPLVVCLTSGALPPSPGYRIARPESPGGLNLKLSSVDELAHWMNDASRRRVFVRFDGEAFHLWEWSYKDLAVVEMNWTALCEAWGLSVPPQLPGRAVSEEESAACYHAWRVTKHLGRKKSAAEEETKTADLFHPLEEPAHIPEDSPLVFVDVETTGGRPAEGARVVQIALTRFNPITGEIEGEFSSLVNPEGRESEYGAWRVHQLSRWQLAKAPLFSRMSKRVFGLLDGAVFVAHNGQVCDEPYVRNELARVGLEWPCLASIDTLRVCRKVYAFMNPKKKDKKPGAPEREKFSFALGSLAVKFCVSGGLAHDAKGDVQTLMGVWDGLRRENPKVTLTEMAGM